MDLDSGAQVSSDGPRVSEEASFKTEVSKEAEVKVVESSSAEEEDEEDEGQTVKSNGSQFNSLLSEFDDFVANENSGQMATSRAMRYGFDVGDLVWGKVKSHPWWPGHIFNEAFATPQVRRTRREGHVLVAFFGDSSYGWFDPADFIPFDANFSEKSKQTSSRNFTKAVEEAVDEASRRCSLGLACKCRSPYSFRPTSVQGYFVVDVPDYEPHAVYSVKQIQTARDSFRPKEALSFVKSLALSPCLGNEKDLEFVKNKATVTAYRKAVFEEFDVTYAQAFGVQPGRPAHDRADSRDQPKQPPRAPLSGPLVIAETLGGGKSSTKEKKVKDSSKKDKYLLKRRDESGTSQKGSQNGQGKESSAAVSLASSEGSVAIGDKDYKKPEIVNKTDADSNSNGSEAGTIKKGSASDSNVAQDMSIDPKSSLDKGKGARSEVYEGSGSVLDSIAVSKGADKSVESKDVTLKTDGALQSSKSEAHGSADSMSTDREDGNHGMGTVHDCQSVEGQSTSSAEPSSGHSKVTGVIKTKVKRPREEDAENPAGEGKKKQKKKQLETETNSKKPQKHSVQKNSGLSAGKKVGKPSLTPKKQLKIKQSKKIASSSNLSESSGTLHSSDLGVGSLEVPQLLSDLQVLALDPFHGKERSSPTIVRKFFLQFRSLVYQKSLSQSPPPESEPLPSKSPATSVGASDNTSTEPIKEPPSTKPAKPTFRSEDPTISGRKRSSSDRQEDIAAKRSKKVDEIRTLTGEKKPTQKAPEPYRSGEGREAAVPLGRRTKPDSSKRSEPTMLVMKFPPKTSLPSVAELKARFARFGPIDQSGLRVFWKSLTCRIVFLHRSDAQAACRYAAANSTPPGMRCFLKDYADLVANEDTPAEPLRLKSCLKKPPADEPAAQSRAAPRVKFMLGGEEASSSSSSAAMRNNKNSSGATVPPPSTSSLESDFSLVRKVVPPILPLPQLPKLSPLNNSSHFHHHHDVVKSNDVDISHQMLSLLARCNDVVASVTGFLGYVPYHPL